MVLQVLVDTLEVIVRAFASPVLLGLPDTLENGLGLYRGLMPLPDAGRRLHLEDPHRVELFARRFAPRLCVAFDDGVEMIRRDGAWRQGPGTRRLTESGEVELLEAL